MCTQKWASCESECIGLRVVTLYKLRRMLVLVRIKKTYCECVKIDHVFRYTVVVISTDGQIKDYQRHKKLFYFLTPHNLH